jgi:2-polyprenyl-3-methyl-5-hydroxy-6-metoxy-1,4-benzoquinol methylase
MTPSTPSTPFATAAAVSALANLVGTQQGGDSRYFHNQLPRYTRTVNRIQNLCTPPCRVLDIGSHYLHQSVLLSKLGYDVTGMDIELFTGAGFVQDRARRCGIRNITVNHLESGDFLPDHAGAFDLIVFTEILEHITFNPIRFWARVYELLAPAGMVYLSTPNALRPAAWARGLAGLLAFRGIGISVKDILGDVTYGHHWKEYSAFELKRYFAMLSPDFKVSTDWYSSDLHEQTNPSNSQAVTRFVKSALAVVPCFRSDIEAVIRLTGRAGFTATPPQLRMQQQQKSQQNQQHQLAQQHTGQAHD